MAQAKIKLQIRTCTQPITWHTDTRSSFSWPLGDARIRIRSVRGSQGPCNGQVCVLDDRNRVSIVGDFAPDRIAPRIDAISNDSFLAVIGVVSGGDQPVVGLFLDVVRQRPPRKSHYRICPVG